MLRAKGNEKLTPRFPKKMKKHQPVHQRGKNIMICPKLNQQTSEERPMSTTAEKLNQLPTTFEMTKTSQQ